MKLGAYLKRHDLTAVSFAALIGVVPSTVSHWLRGRKFPSPRHLRRIGVVTEGRVTSEDFLDGLRAGDGDGRPGAAP